MIIESKFHHQIQKESYVIQLNVLSETKILFYLEDAEKEGIYYDLSLKKTIRKLDIEYYPFNKFILSQDESKLGVYNLCKRQLIIYDMENNDRKLFKRRFKLLGVYNNQIIGIFKLAAIIIQFDCTFVKQLLSTNLFKKPYLIELVGNRLFIRRKDQFHVLRLNQSYGYELKFQKEYRYNEMIQFVKTGQNIYFQLTDETKGYYLFKNGNQLKKISWRFLYDDVFQKILCFNQNRVCMRQDGDEFIYFMQLVNFPLFGMKFKHNVQKYEVVANNKYIIKWNKSETTISVFKN